MSTIVKRTELLPPNVQKEIVAKSKEGKEHFKRIKWPSEFKHISTTKDVQLTINDSNSGNVFFSEIIKSGFITQTGYQGVLTGGTSRFFKNLLSQSSTTTVSALYEHVRGYVYRDFSISSAENWSRYLATTAGNSGLIISKTLSSASHAAAFKGGAASGTLLPDIGITSARIIAMNRGFFKDRIKAGTWRMKIKPTDTSLTSQKGIDFENDFIVDSTLSGVYAAVTGMAGLTGSLSAGISGCMLTGFTILMRIKPSPAGPDAQTLLFRRSGDPSQSALDHTLATAVNNMIVQHLYSDLSPLSAMTNTSTWYSQTSDFFVPKTTFSNITGGTSAVFKLTNKGGGILRWTLSADNSYVKFNIAQRLPLLNGSFSSAIESGYNALTSSPSGWVNAGTGSTNEIKGLTGGTSIVWTSTTFGDMTGGKARFRQVAATDAGFEQALWQAVPVSAGASGIIISYDINSTFDSASFFNGPFLIVEVRLALPFSNSIGITAPQDSISISGFVDTYGKIENQIITDSSSATIRRTRHVNLIGRAPHWEWGELNKSTPSAWIGFYMGAGVGNINSYGSNEFRIQRIQVECVPSTIYGTGNLNSSTATITAWLDSSVSAQTEQDFNLIITDREKNFEKCPNFPISINFHISDDSGIWSEGPPP